MKINLTKREIDFILYAMSNYWLVGDYEIKGHASAKHRDTAGSIKEKLRNIIKWPCQGE